MTLTVTDKDSGASSVSTQVIIVAVQLQTDAADPNKTALLVGGTSNDDTIRIVKNDGGMALGVTINGIDQGVFSPSGRIIIFGQAGNDDIKLADSVSNDAWLYGGAGNDVLKGGAGNNVLLGDNGNDTLFGSVGRNLMIGGTGSDWLQSLSGDDIMIGGSTVWDANEAALLAIMAEWTSTADYVTRVYHLRGSLDGGANGAFRLNADTVIDDGAIDTLFGSGGNDWYIIGVGDDIKDMHNGELIG